MTNAKNRIPRAFGHIVAEVLVPTSCDREGDILRITRSSSGYSALNTRTGVISFVFAAWLRNPAVFRILRIEEV